MAPAAREGGDKRQAPAALGQFAGVTDGRLAWAARIGHGDNRHAVGGPDHLDHEHPARA